MVGVNSVFQQKHVWVDSGQASANNSLVEESLARQDIQNEGRIGTREDSLCELPCRRLLRVSVDHVSFLYRSRWESSPEIGYVALARLVSQSSPGKMERSDLAEV